MVTVFDRPQSPSHAVVLRSRRRAAALALAVAFGARPSEALADDMDPDPPPKRSYSTLLGSTYVAAPLLALAVGGALSELEVSDGAAVLGASTMFLAPAVVHMAHDKVEHGPLSFLGLAGSTGLGVVLGGGAGYVLADLGCDPEKDSEGCDFAGLGGAIVGALVGGIAAYTAFAVYDVSNNSALPRRLPSSDQASLQLWLTPLRAPKHERGAASAPAPGVLIGAALRM